MADIPVLLNRVDPDPSWSLEQEGFDPSREGELESLFTIGNGYLGVRGSLSVPIPSSQTDVFLAGIFDRKIRSIPYSELEFLEPHGPFARADPYAEIVPFPSPFELVLSTDAGEAAFEKSDHRSFRRVLDFRGAALHEQVSWRFPMERVLMLRIARMASLSDPHLLLQEVELEAPQGSLRVRLSPCLLGSDLDTKHLHLKLLEKIRTDFGSELATLETSVSRFRIAMGSRTWRDGSPEAGSEIDLKLDPGKPVRILRAIAIHTSREGGAPEEAARSQLAVLTPDLIREQVEIHRKRWAEFWTRADIRFPRYPELTEAQRFNSFQVRSAASRNSTASIGARALSGRAYEGHVFWDTEIFVFPFLLHQFPELAKACLEYRHATLEGARRRARRMGCAGACYAWESTVTGDDVTPEQLLMRSARKVVPIFTGAQQIHVTADIAHAISLYWEKTGDTDWMLRMGAEILVETARFWISRATRELGVFHFRRVVGPDEYHHDVDDNFYTNWMARQNLRAAAESCRTLADSRPSAWVELERRLDLRGAEWEAWGSAAERFYIPPPNRDGVIEQFAGYFDLAPPPPERIQELRPPLNRLLDWDRVNERQIIKQADVLMIPFLFPGALPREVVEANYRYYEPRTDHGSSLSPCVHAAVAAQIGNWKDAERFWKAGLQLDLMDLMNNTALGIHPGNMAGTWQALVFHILRNSNPMGPGVKRVFLEKYGPIERQEGEVGWESKAKS